MADEADQGNDLAQRYMDISLSKHNQPHASSEDCVECGSFIPAARQRATSGTDLCIDCAELDELRRRGR